MHLERPLLMLRSELSLKEKKISTSSWIWFKVSVGSNTVTDRQFHLHIHAYIRQEHQYWTILQNLKFKKEKKYFVLATKSVLGNSSEVKVTDNPSYGR